VLYIIEYFTRPTLALPYPFSYIYDQRHTYRRSYLKQLTVRLETLSKMYDVPIATIRRWARDRLFPGISVRKGGRRIYVDPEKFDRWFRGVEQEKNDRAVER